MTESASPDCTAIMSGISAYLDGEMAEVECAAIDRHCATCPTCAALVAGLRRTLGLCHELGNSPLPDAVLARARESVRQLLDAQTPAKPE